MAKRLTDREIPWFEEVKRRAREHPPTPYPSSASYPSIYAREGIAERLRREKRG